jgi:hypothetical protein
MGATYRLYRSTKRGKRFLVTIHSHGQRVYKMVRSEVDAKALVQHIHKQELAGVNVIAAIQKAREAVAPPPTYPRLKEAVSQWIEGQVAAGDLRASSAINYKSRLHKWVFPELRDVPVNRVTRERLGAIITRMRQGGVSRASVAHVCHPLSGYFAATIETKEFPGPNPAGDLRFFKGKVARSKGKGLSYFEQTEAPKLIEAATLAYPRWATFIMTGLLAGLRWGESAALYKSDIDWKRGRIHVQRTVSRGSSRLEDPKDHDGRWVARPGRSASLGALARTCSGLKGRGQDPDLQSRASDRWTHSVCVDVEIRAVVVCV